MLPQLRKRPSEQTTTATKKNEMLHRYAANVSQRCPVLTAEEILFFLNSVGGETNAEFVAPCSAEGAQLCHIVEYLSVCNNFLRWISMELKEVEPGEFGFFPLEMHLFRQPVGDGEDLCIRGWILLHWLLQEHRCIKTLMLPRTIDPKYQDVLSDALQLNSGLNKLTLRDWQEKEGFSNISAIGTLAHLEELDMGHVCLSPSALGDLGDALPEISTLHTLKLPYIETDFGNTDHDDYVMQLVQALKRLPKITVLSSDDFVLESESINVAFTEFVAESNTLKKLSLHHSNCYEEIDALFTAVGQNNSLEELHLEGFILYEDSEQLLGKVAAQHKGLRYLEVGIYSDYKEWQIEGVALAKLVGCNTGLRELVFVGSTVECLPAFAEAVRKNTTMEKLTLGLLGMDVPDYRVFLQALACNKSLQLVTFREYFNTYFHDIILLMQETGTEGRLEISASIDDAQVFESSLKNSTSLTKIRYFPSYDSRPMLPGAFHHLLQHHHLQELNIRLDHPIEMESATSLALFLSTTSSLRHVALEFRATAASSRILVEGIAGNTSLTSLSISFWTFKAPEADLLWQMLESSKTLKTLTLELLEFEHCQVLDQVPGGLLNNHYLLKATIQQNPEHCPKTFFSGIRVEVQEKLIFVSTQSFQFGVQELVRRNLSTLHRAVQFVMGARGRRFAEAFERVSKGSTLVEALKKATSESEEEMKRKVASSTRYLDEHFLAEAGVVRDTVVCGESSRVQLDRIGLYNWLHIRQFLRVTDIILKPKGLPAGPGSSKKHC
ncbi:unnamed protein product [Ixodes persulcatus]